MWYIIFSVTEVAKMTENEELKIISDSLLKFLIHENNLLSKSVFEIYNNWTASTQTQIIFANNVRWALRFIRNKKNSPVLKNKVFAELLEQK